MKPLIGHTARFEALSRAFSKNQIPQTLLISGPPGVGKSLFVSHYAQLLLCSDLRQNGGFPAPCGVCKACHQVEIEVFPDLRVYRPVISGSEEITAPESLDSAVILISQARAFIEESIRKPTNGPRKVLVIYQFDKIVALATNTLLKTLEEPPSGTFIVLTTENAKNLRDTILSRCWHLPLPPVADAEIAPWLRGEFPSAAPQALGEALRAAAGRPGAARRELERLQKGDGTEGDDTARSRFAVTTEMLKRLDGASPIAALALSEEAMRWAGLWWVEDAGAGADMKKLGAKGPRTAAARFLDELMIAGRALWIQGLTSPRANPGSGGHENGGSQGHSAGEVGAARLDQMRKTRHYILRNANRQLALDVMFGRLIALNSRPVSGPARSR